MQCDALVHCISRCSVALTPVDYTGRVFTYSLMAFLTLDSLVSVVISAGAEFQSCTLGYAKLFSLILDLKTVFNLFNPALLVIPWFDSAFSNSSFMQ